MAKVTLRGRERWMQRWAADKKIERAEQEGESEQEGDERVDAENGNRVVGAEGGDVAGAR